MSDVGFLSDSPIGFRLFKGIGTSEDEIGNRVAEPMSNVVYRRLTSGILTGVVKQSGDGLVF